MDNIILVIWTVWGNTALVVNDNTLSSDRLPDLFSGFRIAQVSDLHNTEFVAPTYYVTGNHEAGCSEYDTLKAGLEAAGITVLEDEIAYLEREGETIALLGLVVPNFTIKGDLFGEVPAMVGTKLKSMYEQETVYSILLSHRPELFETYAACGVDLVLSGHVHGGQFRLPFVGG